MTMHQFLTGVILGALLGAVPAQAHHVVWLDFSNFNLNVYTSVNGNTPPTVTDLAAIKQLVLANMAEDYAPFDLYFTTFRPDQGRYTQVKFLGKSQTGKKAGSILYGCAGPDCCPTGGTCTGIDSWDDMMVSTCEVYAGSFANDAAFMGSNDTTARIANTISHTASHELGHILGLAHANAAADSLAIECTESTCPTATDDQNPTWHIMADGSTWGLTSEQRATRDRFFSIHASRRLLYERLQARNHWATLANLNAGAERSDLLYGRIQSPSAVAWYGRFSNGTQFVDATTWETNAGKAGDLFLVGDVNGDGRADLVRGRIFSASQVGWYGQLSSGNDFGPMQVWSVDAGDAGDIFRLADVNGDGKADLVYGRQLSTTTVRWYARLSTGSQFGAAMTWSSDAGNVGDLFLLGDVNKDGRADLVYGRSQSATQVQWFVRLSNGSSFGSPQVWHDDTGHPGDLFYLADVNGDGRADLVYGHVFSDFHVRWYLRPSTGSAFGSALILWSGGDAGDAGDLFRLGDGNGDGKVDLYYGRPIGITSLTDTPKLSLLRWYGRLSLGNSLASYTTWNTDAGDEGDIFP